MTCRILRVSGAMSLTYRISPSGDRLRIVGKGRITTPGFIRIVGRVLSSPRHRTDATVLVDLRNATHRPNDKTGVIDMARELGHFNPVLKGNIAIVVGPSLAFPAEILAAHLREAMHVAIRVFIDLTAAEAYCWGTGHPSRGAG